jgi:hypothetical protein
MGLSVVACGGSKTASGTSTSPTASASPTPSGSPTPTEKQILVAYLRHMKPLMARDDQQTETWNRLNDQWKWNSTGNWKSVGAKYLRLAKQVDNLAIDIDIVQAPKRLKGAHASLVSAFRITYKSCLLHADKLKALDDTSNWWKQADTYYNQWNKAYEKWRWALKVECRRLHVRIPFHLGTSF